MGSKSFTYTRKRGDQAFNDGRLQSMLCRQVTYHQLQDVFQFYGTLYVEFLHLISPSVLWKGWRENMYRHPCLTHFILISCPLLHTSVTLYTDGLWSLFSKEAGILFTWVSSSRWVFNALDRWLVFIGSAFDEASLRLPRPFFPYINNTSFLFSSISTLLIFWRERPSPIFRQLTRRHF